MFLQRAKQALAFGQTTTSVVVNNQTVAAVITVSFYLPPSL